MVGSCPSVIQKNSDNVTAFFFCFFLLVFNSFDRSPMIYFKENYKFSRLQRGSNIFQGGGGVQLFFHFLFPTETHMTCDFPGGSGFPDPAPLDPRMMHAYTCNCKY